MSSSFVSSSINLDESIYPITPSINLIKADELEKLDELGSVEAKAVKKVKSYAARLVDERMRTAEVEIEKQIQQGWESINRWQQETAELRENYINGIESAVVDIVNSVVGQLLNETTEEQKISALVKQLAECKTAPAQGKLYCNPSRATAVRTALSSQRLFWDINSDPTLQFDSLRLESANGEFSIDWEQAVNLLFIDKGKMGL
ncbi:HrpE/YscL family type III secretion apparatus protein [Veronia pacifica]|uniref:Type III secretion protein n=1 Tax=Veronia pacifica TaxID=1080227 RepID=A0A1C3ER38_9GAMM|nr:HrpE/YscL family type III secretion apparatus protein [Veronia pacifica]ODA35680.1 hypothetical protein A8L45_03435 [Veronia pacifica]